MNFLQSFNEKTILIPLLQRDYVQGGREDVIEPFMDSLLEKECDLNYIYGYEEDGCFVPIDGQQRLATLWLLYLYLFARKQRKGEFNVRMKFASREYAEDFCERLSENLEKLLNKVDDGIPLDKVIIDQNWFIHSWLNNTSVKNVLGTIKIIHKKICKENLPFIWNNLVESTTPSITFAFLQMDENNGLDDDIYIKMNGRGRKLSAFENLKSFMDEHISNYQFASDWRRNMDNMWADMFWINRNRLQEHPEEIDDEQLYCLYNLLILYHINKDELSTAVTCIKDEKRHLYEDLLSFLDKNEKTEMDDVIKSIIVRLQKAGYFPLVWLERLHLLSDGFYNFAYHKLNFLASLSPELNQLELYIGADSTEKTTRSYQLCMSENSFDRTFPLMYALLCYRRGITSLFDWMRTMRNLILNTEINDDKLPTIMQAIDKMAILCEEQGIYKILQLEGTKNVLQVFNQEQVKEEIIKSTALEYYEQMIKLENGRFFRGCINILFRLLSCNEQTDYDTMTLENVISYSSILLEIFDGSDKGISSKFDDDKFLLRRALISCKPYRFGKERNAYWSFNDGINEWREYINSNRSDIRAFQFLLKELLVPAFKSGEDIYTTLKKYVENVSKRFEECTKEEDENFYRYHFIRYPYIWEYMTTKRCKWKDNNYDIELRASNSNNSNRMELRTMSLYLDYLDEKNLIFDSNDWEIGIWPKWKSCLYFNCKTLPENKKIAIDVYFYDDNENRSNENCYSFDLFIRPTHPAPINEEEEKNYANEDYKQNIYLFSSLIPQQMNLFKRKDDGRLHSNRVYARQELKTVLRAIMNEISINLKKQ